MHGELTDARHQFKMVAINRIRQTVNRGNLCPETQQFPVLQDTEDAQVWKKFTGRDPPYCNDCLWIFYPNHTLFKEYGVVNLLESESYSMVMSHLILASQERSYNPAELGPLFTRNTFPLEFGDVQSAPNAGTTGAASAAWQKPHPSWMLLGTMLFMALMLSDALS